MTCVSADYENIIMLMQMVVKKQMMTRRQFMHR